MKEPPPPPPLTMREWLAAPEVLEAQCRSKSALSPLLGPPPSTPARPTKILGPPPPRPTRSPPIPADLPSTGLSSLSRVTDIRLKRWPGIRGPGLDALHGNAGASSAADEGASSPKASAQGAAQAAVGPSSPKASAASSQPKPADEPTPAAGSSSSLWAGENIQQRLLPSAKFRSKSRGNKMDRGE